MMLNDVDDHDGDNDIDVDDDDDDESDGDDINCYPRHQMISIVTPMAVCIMQKMAHGEFAGSGFGGQNGNPNILKRRSSTLNIKNWFPLILKNGEVTKKMSKM